MINITQAIIIGIAVFLIVATVSADTMTTINEKFFGSVEDLINQTIGVATNIINDMNKNNEAVNI